MKEQLEIAMQEYMETLSYFGEPIAEGYMRGYSDTPDGLTVIIIDIAHPSEESEVRNQRRGNINIAVRATGTVHFLYRKQVGEDTLDDAEERNDRIPEMVYEEMIKDPTLGGRIPGNLEPKNLKGGLFEMENTEDSEFCMSAMEVEYNGAWISPITE